MKFFSKEEVVAIIVILLMIGLASYGNILASLRRSRDFDRKSDVNQVINALAEYQQDFGFYPPSNEEGQIVACKKYEGKMKVDIKENEFRDLEQILLDNLDSCNWGEDQLRDVTDPNYLPYLETLPDDPHHNEGVRYYYRSNTRHFQLYAALEGRSEDEYDPKIEELGLMCGERICNFGKTVGTVPLDKSLEEYENELEEKKR